MVVVLSRTRFHCVSRQHLRRMHLNRKRNTNLLLCLTYVCCVQLPMGSAAQQAALQCYCLQFKPQDHSFLLQSNVFTNVSKALSLTEENQDTTPQEKKMRDKVSHSINRNVCTLPCILVIHLSYV